MGACKKLNISADELNVLWGKAKKAGNLVKFGGGFYCGLINDVRARPRHSPPPLNSGHTSRNMKHGCFSSQWVGGWQGGRLSLSSFRELRPVRLCETRYMSTQTPRSAHNLPCFS